MAFIASLLLAPLSTCHLHETGHGSHWHLEPFYTIGYHSESFQTAFTLSLEVPVDADHGETEGGYGIYFIKPAGHHLHFIGELQGHTVLNGEEKMETSFDAAGGVRIYPFGNDSMNIGVGIKLPLDEDGYETLLSFMYHL
jgi:hypothetical protein